MSRRILQQRRMSLTFDLVFKNQTRQHHRRLFPTGEIGEVFLATGKSGSDLASLVRDAAITLSLALQHGVKIETIRHAVLRDSRGEPLSLVGAVIDELAPGAVMTWQTPRELPDLRRVGMVALDTETHDEGLQADRGSSWPWRDGYVCGISVACRARATCRSHLFSDAPSRHRQLRSRRRSTAGSRTWSPPTSRIVTLNGIYDWGWLRTDGGIVMPPSDRLEEIGALATIVDENQFRYSLDALCERYGLPGKDETPAATRRSRPPASRRAERSQRQGAHLAIAGALCRPVCRGRRGENARAVRGAQPGSGSGRDARRLSARSRPVADGAWRCAAAAFGSIRTPPNRRATIACETRCRAGRAFGAARHTPSAWPRSNAANGKCEPSTLRHRLSAHGERQPIIRGRQIRMDGEA